MDQGFNDITGIICPFCGSNTARVYDEPLEWFVHKIQLKYVYCKSCELVSTRHVPKNKDDNKSRN